MMYTAWYVHKIIVLWSWTACCHTHKSSLSFSKVHMLSAAESCLLCANFDRACNYECFCWKILTTVSMICIRMCLDSDSLNAGWEQCYVQEWFGLLVWIPVLAIRSFVNTCMYAALDRSLPVHGTGTCILHIWCTNACCHCNWSASRWSILMYPPGSCILHAPTWHSWQLNPARSLDWKQGHLLAQDPSQLLFTDSCRPC